MDILQANKAYFPHVGGIETVVQSIAEGAACRNGNRSRVVACSDDRRSRHEMRNGVHVTYTATMARVSSLPISPAYARRLLERPADILHVHEPSLLAPAAYLARRSTARRRFQRLVVWWHSDIVRQRSCAPIYTPILRSILREAHAIVVASPKHVTSSAFLPEFASKCRVVHYGIDPAQFEPTPAVEQRAAEFRRAACGKPIVMFSGRLVYYKGVEFLVESMRSLPEAHLMVVGRGPMLPRLEALAAQCPDNVSFLSFLPRQDLAAAYRASDVFVLPSVENAEAFGVVQLEAMACGKPVITTDLRTGVTYVNQHERTGLVVPRRDPDALAGAIRTLIRDPDRRRAMGEYARERVLREFTSDQMVDGVLSVYDSLAGSPACAVVRTAPEAAPASGA